MHHSTQTLPIISQLAKLYPNGPIRRIHIGTTSEHFDNISVKSIIGGRSAMEDTYLIYNMSESITIYGVFDGHGGTDVALAIRDKLPQYIADELLLLTDLNNQGAVSIALVNAFIKADRDLYAVSSESQKYLAGSTAVVCLKVGSTLYLANLGDSRGLIFDESGQIQISTEDHKPNNEVERIKAAGGLVCFGRVNGSLAVSRAFGDFSYKLINNKYMGQLGAVSCKPDIYIYPIKPGTILFMATDGLWDHLSNSDVISRYSQDENYSSTIVNFLFSNYVLTDNVTVLTVKF